MKNSIIDRPPCIIPAPTTTSKLNSLHLGQFSSIFPLQDEVAEAAEVSKASKIITEDFNVTQVLEFNNHNPMTNITLF